MAIVWLDSGIIGLVTNPHKKGEARACENWMLGLAARGVYVVSSSLCDYEVRRNLILESTRTGNYSGLNNLDEITAVVSFLSVTDESLLSTLRLIFGAGTGGGIAMLYVICAVCMFLVGLCGFSVPTLRNLETNTPDHDEVALRK